MALRLVVCARCSRHVRDAEARCPFCGVTRGSVTRAAALGASLIVAGCGSTTTLPGDAGAPDAIADAHADGATHDASADAGAEDASTPQDAASADSASPQDADVPDTNTGFDGGGIPLYGAPPSPGGPRWGEP